MADIFSKLSESASQLRQAPLRTVVATGMAILALAVFSVHANADTKCASCEESIVRFSPQNGYFPLASNGTPAGLHIDETDDSGVIRALGDLQADLSRVTGTNPHMTTGSLPESDYIVIAGTMGNNPLIDQLVADGHIDASNLEGKWEKFIIREVANPFPGVGSALVIAGSDRRGTIFGIYELSRQIGVSPWFWWADVPVQRQSDLYVKPEPFTTGEPGVQYRGIFINNENPALLGWVEEKYGWFTHEFYSEVFELILRLQGNYLWPAMWGKAFHDDDPMNPKLADEYGIVIGYTHHEPLMRAHVEWSRYGEGPWDYEENTERLQKFWKEGIERIRDYETTVTLGMRGDGDEPMSAERNIALMERIIGDQREIIEEYAGNPEEIVPYWALYKEVQEYYEMGMDVPEDVMIFLANDNWGNIRLLPDPETAHEREGGWGMYYHFDYVGGPRNYKWINTIQISRIWEQMNLAWEHDVNRLWLVNVGDIKPMEFPISFFLDYAWNPDRMDVNAMNRYPVYWAKQQFGSRYAEEIGHLLTEYTRINSRQKPELLSPDTYSLVHAREWERVVTDYRELARKATEIYSSIPGEYRDAYYQLVQYPVEASANLNQLYYTVAKNRHYAEQGRTKTNVMADQAREYFNRDKALSEYYNYEMSDGKWQHMMDQAHIGYTYWQQPPVDRMPDVDIIHHPPYDGPMGVAVEGSRQWWPGGADTHEARLPSFDKYHRQAHYIEIFNRGREQVHYTLKTDVDWLHLSRREGAIELQDRVTVTVDWEKAPVGTHHATLTVNGPDEVSVDVQATVHNPATPSREDIQGFVESNGHIAIEAPNYTRSVSKGDIHWKHIPQLGRTESAMTPFPVLANSQLPGDPDTPRLEYDLHLFNSGEVTVRAYLSPTKNYSKNYRNPEGIHYGVSFNEDTPQIINMHIDMIDGFDNNVWYDWVAENSNMTESTHIIDEPGHHTLKFWMQDTGLVLQRIVIETEDTGATFLGPPQSFFNHE